jgi:hypothetical protein
VLREVGLVSSSVAAQRQGTAYGCAGEDFLAAYRVLEPRYAAEATG